MRNSHALATVLLALLLTACGGEKDPAPKAAPQRSAEVLAKAAFFATVREAARARKRGDLEEAMRLYRKALESNAEHEGALVDLARTLRELDRRAEALVVLERLSKSYPKLSRPYFLIAEVLTENPDVTGDELDRAMALYERALEIEPNISGPRLGLARAQRRQGLGGAAEASYRTVLGTNPESQEALTGLGQVLLDRGAPALAVPVLVRSLEVGTKAKGRRDVPSEMDTQKSFDAASLDAPANRAALDALARAARALGGYPDEVPAPFRKSGNGSGDGK